MTTIQDVVAEEKTIHLNLKVGKTQYEGDFTFRRPTIRELSQIGVATTRRNGDLQNVPTSTNVLNSALSYFEVCLKARPTWFKDPESLRHEEVIFKLFTELMEWLREDEEVSAE